MESDDRLREVVERTRYHQELQAALPGYLRAQCFAFEAPRGVAPDPARAPFMVNLLETYDAPPLYVAVTSGVGCLPQVNLAPGVEDRFIELAAVSPRMGPRLVQLLSILAATVHDPSRQLPISGWDRVAFPAPMYGRFGGAILKWLGVVTLSPEHPVTLFDALPITVEELRRFREDGAAHGAWVEERLAKQDYGEIHERWTTLFE